MKTPSTVSVASHSASHSMASRSSPTVASAEARCCGHCSGRRCHSKRSLGEHADDVGDRVANSRPDTSLSTSSSLTSSSVTSSGRRVTSRDTVKSSSSSPMTSVAHRRSKVSAPVFVPFAECARKSGLSGLSADSLGVKRKFITTIFCVMFGAE